VYSALVFWKKSSFSVKILRILILYFPAFTVKIRMLEVNMKKLVITAVFLAAIIIGSPLSAQQIPPEQSSDFYYVNVTLEKVYPTRLGYILVYRKGVNEVGRVGIPNEWFTFAGAKAELITLPRGKNWPSLTVYYKDGEFSHVRLYVHRERSHDTWGNVPLGANIAPYFQNKDTIELEL
jgi:hypothetical protein